MDKIKQTALNIITKFQTNDPLKIIECLNIIIVYDDLGNSLDGFLQQVDKHFIIHVNTRKPPCPSVIAHELGHYFLHQSINHFKVGKSSLFFPLEIEQEANQFASELLLTDDMLYSMLESFHPYSIQELSSHFELPIHLIELKLATLSKDDYHL